MISTHLINDLHSHLKDAKEIWISVALIKDSAFNLLQVIIPPDTKQSYLIGVDLPTPPAVLRVLQKKQSPFFRASIFKSEATFHPKVYIIRKEFEYVAFIGSSNLTDGGLENNIEMNVLIRDQVVCQSLVSWFENLYKNSFPLSDANIAVYESYFSIIANHKSDIKKAKAGIHLKRPEAGDNLLEGIDFADRYFKKEHHLAFRNSLWRDSSSSANRERKKVSDRFLNLHEIIYKRFSEFGIHTLFCNVTNHIVSMYFHPPDRPQKIDAMWLSYGKSQEEINQYHKLFPKVHSNSDEDDLQSFINHARLQVRIELRQIGIWILFGKNNSGSLFDRQHFKNKMVDFNYRNEFYKRITDLPAVYKVTVNQISKPVGDFQDADDLHEFCKKDQYSKYFFIGIDYNISDPEMSETLLPETVLNEFSRLYPIYEMMTDRRFLKI